MGLGALTSFSWDSQIAWPMISERKRLARHLGVGFFITPVCQTPVTLTKSGKRITLPWLLDSDWSKDRSKNTKQ